MTQSLNEVFGAPIPLYDSRAKDVWEQANVAFDFHRPESNEPMVSVAEKGLLVCPMYAGSKQDRPETLRNVPAESQVLLRVSVVERLVRMQEALRPFGLQPLVLDGHRSLAVQGRLWNEFYLQVARKNSGLTHSEIRALTSRYCWDPDRWDIRDPFTWPVHTTGGAVDMTLRTLGQDEPLSMGSSFDDPAPISHADYFEQLLVKDRSSDALNSSDLLALHHRRVLHNAARSVGFTHYWAEWWHFDFGTQLFARASAVLGLAPVAFYTTL